MFIKQRIAFLTPEFVTEPRNGGIGAYVETICNALHAEGHEVVVIVSGDHTESIEHAGYRVERVDTTPHLGVRLIRKIILKIAGNSNASLFLELVTAYKTARHLRRLHEQNAFTIVQYPNYEFMGLFVSRQASYRRLMRLSSSRLLWTRTSGRALAFRERLAERLDVRCIRASDGAYAPSRFLADYFRRTYGVDLQVIRPPTPAFLAKAANTGDGEVLSDEIMQRLPARFYFHYGKLGPRKGTDLVAEAFERALARDDSLWMVWAGSPNDTPFVQSTLRRFPRAAERTVVLGRLRRVEIMGVLKRCEAAVLPSLADNIPNTALEALAAQRPIIAFNGASLDEIVVPHVDGLLCDYGCAKALSRALVDYWRNPMSCRREPAHPVAGLATQADGRDAARQMLTLGLPAMAESPMSREEGPRNVA